MDKHLKLLKQIVEFFNWLPNKKFSDTDTYSMVGKLESTIEYYKIREKLLLEAVNLLNVIRVDACMAINGEWDCTNEEGIKDGFGSQIHLIDKFIENEIRSKKDV